MRLKVFDYLLKPPEKGFPILRKMPEFSQWLRHMEIARLRIWTVYLLLSVYMGSIPVISFIISILGRCVYD